jgi:hypothetical protein
MLLSLLLTSFLHTSHHDVSLVINNPVKFIEIAETTAAKKEKSKRKRLQKRLKRKLHLNRKERREKKAEAAREAIENERSKIKVGAPEITDDFRKKFKANFATAYETTGKDGNKVLSKNLTPIPKPQDKNLGEVKRKVLNSNQNDARPIISEPTNVTRLGPDAALAKLKANIPTDKNDVPELNNTESDKESQKKRKNPLRSVTNKASNLLKRIFNKDKKSTPPSDAPPTPPSGKAQDKNLMKELQDAFKARETKPKNQFSNEDLSRFAKAEPLPALPSAPAA